MKKPFQLNPNPETTGEAFRRIAEDHGFPVGEDGKIVDSGFHPGTWPDGQPKQWIGDDTVPLDPKVCAAVYMAALDREDAPSIVYVIQYESGGIPERPDILQCTRAEADTEFENTIIEKELGRKDDESDEDWFDRNNPCDGESPETFWRSVYDDDKSLRMWAIQLRE